MSLISPSLILGDSCLFTPKVSKLKPGDPPGFYARVLASRETLQHPAWKELEAAIAELAEQTFGAGYKSLVKDGSFRSPIRRDVATKGWPDTIVAFLNLKSGGDYKPTIVGRDALPIMDQSEVYPGCIVRVSLRPYAYGGRGTGYGAGVSFGLENIQKMQDGERLKTSRGDGSEFGRVDEESFASMLG
jgi:hypothetical protein